MIALYRVENLFPRQNFSISPNFLVQCKQILYLNRTKYQGDSQNNGLSYNYF